ncbi:shikimate dehydrogenase [Antarcticibacterium arcticum]|uniref:Shikimate dehydrogenase n=1 Tax=Antarcticibacterium arcticum TaxID=2585771 RepID=A0A5B8YHM4_9FLAO|nr:shikimate dehydrogenase [Antarcticibacterium arcticum]QED37430.1 shikimate dehydrogenase [Antarcticibacterium arcticum]
MRTFGLLGKNIAYSFSAGFFNKKFAAEDIPATYKNFDLQDISEFPGVIKSHPELQGLNVTIPYKQEIIPYLDRLDPVAREIGAVNTIKFEKDGSLTGHNTDHFGFTRSIKAYLQPHHTQALILGTGGASKAVAYSLRKMGIEVKFVSRNLQAEGFSYDTLTAQHLKQYTVIVNCTPLGTSPNFTSFPPIPVEHLTSAHLIFDLIYNPAITQLMKLGIQQNATAVNGLHMLEFQAEKSWEIWNSPH